MTQAQLFEAPPLIRSPLCSRDPHCGGQTVELGPVERYSADCESQAAICVRCGKTGRVSRNLAAGRQQR